MYQNLIQDAPKECELEVLTRERFRNEMVRKWMGAKDERDGKD